MCFFFQAEDGIRDGHVTGVQTCALPISEREWEGKGDAGGEGSASGLVRSSRLVPCLSRPRPLCPLPVLLSPPNWRSEERRVGKSVDSGGRRRKRKRRGKDCTRRGSRREE